MNATTFLQNEYGNADNFNSRQLLDGLNAIEQYLLIDLMDKFATELANEAKSENEKCTLHSVMPSLHTFKERRDKLKLTLRQVAEETKVSAATISRIERAEGECSYHNVVQLDDYYCRNGA